jgi:WD40 repeat protein
MFAATDYAGNVALWDARSPNVPLGRTEAHEGKALCLHFLPPSSSGGGFRLLSGGSDCNIKVTAVESGPGKAGDAEEMDASAD